MKLYELERQARRLSLPHYPDVVLVILISHSDRSGDGTAIFPSIKTLALEAKCSERTAQRAMRYLIEEGWIVAIYRKGGQGKPSSYNLNLDQFGGLAALPVPIEKIEWPLTRRLNFARGMLKRLAADSSARPKWEQEVADLEQQLAPTSNDQAAHLPAIPETPVPRYLPAATNDQALVPMIPDADLEQIEALYLGMITLQANEPEQSPKWKWWQGRIDQALIAYNQALDDRGIVASDGQRPVIDTEMQEQIQQWSRKVQERQENRDQFVIGSPKWLRWNAMLERATRSLNGLLYQQEQQGGYVT